MTAARRRAPLPLLAVMMLAAVFVWSPPAEALTETVLIKNTGQSVSMTHTELWPASFPKPRSTVHHGHQQRRLRAGLNRRQVP